MGVKNQLLFELKLQTKFKLFKLFLAEIKICLLTEASDFTAYY